MLNRHQRYQKILNIFSNNFVGNEPFIDPKKLKLIISKVKLN